MSPIVFWIVQAVGLLGSVLIIGAMQFNNRRVILLCYLTACVCWLFHYGMLGATTAVVINVIALLRSLLFLNNHKPWAKSRLWLVLILAALVLTSALTWDGWPSLLPCIAMILTTFALWTHNSRTTRLLMLANSPCWLVYNLLAGSYSCAVTEGFALVSYLIAVVRFDVLHQSPEKKQR